MVRGTGKSERSEYVEMAGKTGTAVVDYFRADQGRKKYQGSFAGYFPADNPKYSLIVLMSDPRKNGYYGGDVALPAFREIAERVMALEPVGLNTLAVNEEQAEGEEEAKSIPEVQLASFAYKPDINALSKALQIQYELVTESDWVDWTKGEADRLEAREMTESTMPDLRGMGLRDAVFLLENAGLKVRVKGVGKVKRQSIRAGKEVSKGTQVILELS